MHLVESERGNSIDTTVPKRKLNIRRPLERDIPEPLTSLFYESYSVPPLPHSFIQLVHYLPQAAIMESPAPSTQASSSPSSPPADETPNQKQARLRRERRHAKIAEEGSSRLEKITQVSGRQNLPGKSILQLRLIAKENQVAELGLRD